MVTVVIGVVLIVDVVVGMIWPKFAVSVIAPFIVIDAWLLVPA